jgi:hypothetical protein
MKLGEKTVTVLKNFSQINPSLLIKEGDVLSTISPSKSILGKAKVPNTFDTRCAIYELSKFLGGFSIAENPEIEFGSEAVTIKDANSTQSIRYAAESNIKAPPDKNLTLPGKDVSVDFTETQLKNVIRGAGVYSLPDIAFVGDGSTVSLQALDAKNNDGNIYSIAIGNTDKTFRVIFKVENILKIMPGNYHVDISSKLISHFTNPEIEYWVGVESTSTFS